MSVEAYRLYAAAQAHPGHAHPAALNFFATDAEINVVHPYNRQEGRESYRQQVIFPPLEAFRGLYRRDHIVMSGAFDGSEWISATGYYAGRFTAPWLGIPPTGELAYLRFGEFHRMEGREAVQSYVFLDIPEFMAACGCWPIAAGPGETRGFRGRIPGPATQDGLAFPRDQKRGVESAEMVTTMLRALNTPDEAWRPFWHDNMAWYGPGAFGSFLGVEAFRSFQVPFESQFEGWSGGAAGNGMTAHFTRFGDGDYVCSGGWPSLTGINVKPFLGQAASGERVFMRVCDWWRREGDLLVENWVFVDVPHVLLQLGRDVLGELQ
ncbi:MAG: hypothetical protein AAGA47_13350 [Pseudomonadota bacterium]